MPMLTAPGVHVLHGFCQLGALCATAASSEAPYCCCPPESPPYSRCKPKHLHTFRVTDVSDGTVSSCPLLFHGPPPLPQIVVVLGVTGPDRLPDTSGIFLDCFSALHCFTGLCGYQDLQWCLRQSCLIVLSNILGTIVVVAGDS